ncbi:MAG TPA: MerR family transcriptional regulator [Vicinamibacterales bacterium]
MTDRTYDLRELCNAAGVTPRTVHYYIQQGLLPPAGERGPGARYGEEHLLRLVAIRRLQRAHLPLAEIRRQLEHATESDLRALAESPEPPGSALEFIRETLAMSVAPGRTPIPWRSPTARDAETPKPRTGPERSQWERLSLHPDVELHIRRPLSRELNRRVDRLVALARALMEDQTS